MSIKLSFHLRFLASCAALGRWSIAESVNYANGLGGSRLIIPLINCTISNGVRLWIAWIESSSRLTCRLFATVSSLSPVIIRSMIYIETSILWIILEIVSNKSCMIQNGTRKIARSSDTSKRWCLLILFEDKQRFSVPSDRINRLSLTHFTKHVWTDLNRSCSHGKHGNFRIHKHSLLFTSVATQQRFSVNKGEWETRIFADNVKKGGRC